MINHKKNRFMYKQKYIFHFFWRIIDIFGSMVAILFTFPLCLVVGILIKMEDPKGSIFFKQERVGKNGRLFMMYKFRSMIMNAEEELEQLQSLNEIEGHMFKIANDPRITKMGRWMREKSIDEFPQFINVLKGDMSLIGPRPPLLSEYQKYTAYEKSRLSVLPGCTGLWQVSGRNALDFNQMVELDLYYIEKQSFGLNVRIFFKTLKVIFVKSNGM